MASRTFSLKVNQRVHEERERREKERQASKIQATISGPAPKPRKRKGLNFHEPGYYVSQAEQARKRAKLEALQKRIAESAAKTGIADAVKLATLVGGSSITNSTANATPATVGKQSTTDTATAKPLDDPKLSEIKLEDQIPDVEWWDKPILRNQSLDVVVLKMEQQYAKPEDIFNGITNLVEHPQVIKPPGPDLSTIQTPLFLTKGEKKKLRRQNRRAAELEKQEKIKLGLLPQPEPKLKRSNIMHVLGNEAIVNPSKAEQMVREQEERRQQAHIEHNESKKLDVKEKKLKKLRKVQEDLSVTGTWVSVYRVLCLNSPAHKYKVIQNAKQLTMTGVLALHKDINLVVVEGGPKQQRKYKHLMLDRIKWSDDPIVDESNAKANSETTTTNKCLLVWEGRVIGRSFRGFKVKQLENEEDAKLFFQQHKVNYWDMAVNVSILESIEP